MVKKYKYINTEKQIVDLTDKKVIIWGKSASALQLYVDLAQNARVIGFTDSFTNAPGTFAGLPFYPYTYIKDMKDIVVYIATRVMKYQIEILELLKETELIVLCRGTVWGPYEYDVNLMKNTVEHERVLIDEVKKALCDEKSVKTFDNLIKYRTTNNYRLIEEVYEEEHLQYFPADEIIKPSEEEIFIDAGGYNGDTSVQFSKWVNGRYKKIYILEPDPLMQVVAREYVKLKELNNIEVVGKGAYSENAILKFASAAESGSSNINNNGIVCIETISIDSLLEGNKATYIKMDIEGAEMAALIGARETIEKYKPNLAISIYHKDDDLWKIPYYIMENYPWYRLYMRHYALTTNETVLYAVV